MDLWDDQHQCCGGPLRGAGGTSLVLERGGERHRVCLPLQSVPGAHAMFNLLLLFAKEVRKWHFSAARVTAPNEIWVLLVSKREQCILGRQLPQGILCLHPSSKLPNGHTSSSCPQDAHLLSSRDVTPRCHPYHHPQWSQ